MIEIFKLHWEFLVRPSESIKKYISKLPLSLGLYIYIFYLFYSNFQNGGTYSKLSDLLFLTFRINDELFVYFYIILIISYSILIYSKIMPIFLRILSNIPKENFQSENYKKAIFYSPTSYIVFSIMIILPLQVIFSLLSLKYDLGLYTTFYFILYWILSLWSLVLIFNIFVIQWKAIRIFYNLNNFKTFLMIFILPFIFFIPFLAIYISKFSEYLKYINN